MNVLKANHLLAQASEGPLPLISCPLFLQDCLCDWLYGKESLSPSTVIVQGFKLLMQPND